MQSQFVRQILPHVKEFRKFWKEKGPFRYALTSIDFPPILLEPEEWLFGNDITQLLKELMGFDLKKMEFVQAPFNPENQSILRPQGLIPWKITHFPEQWNDFDTEVFVPEGHLTLQVMAEVKVLRSIETAEGVQGDPKSREKAQIEKGFFSLLEKNLDCMGYLLLKPLGNSKFASTNAYLSEWEEDEEDAGLL